MKIVFFTWGPHHDAAFMPVYEGLIEKGLNPIIQQGWHNETLPKDTDIAFITSNRSRPKMETTTKTFLIPHGIGLESWEADQMNLDTIVFLNGKKPWTPPIEATNWQMVGWAKSDALFHPKAEMVTKAKELVSNLPFKESLLLVPSCDPNDLPNIDFMVDYLGKQEINVIIPFRQRSQGYNFDEAYKRYIGFKHIVMPEMLNLYYLAPHIRIVVAMGYTSLAREFYITSVPTMHAGFGFEECKCWCYPIIRDFPKFFPDVWANPKKYHQPPEVIKDFFEINDGKVVERIIKEVEKI